MLTKRLDKFSGDRQVEISNWESYQELMRSLREEHIPAEILTLIDKQQDPDYKGCVRGIPPGVLSLEIIARVHLIIQGLLNKSFWGLKKLDRQIGDLIEDYKYYMEQHGSNISVDKKGFVYCIDKFDSPARYEFDSNAQAVVVGLSELATKVQPDDKGNYDMSQQGSAANDFYFSVNRTYHSNPELPGNILGPMAEAGIPLEPPERDLYHRYLRQKRAD